MKVGCKKGGCGVSFSLPMHRGRCGWHLATHSHLGLLTPAGAWLTMGVARMPGWVWVEGLHLNKAAYLSQRDGGQGSQPTTPNIKEQ